MFNSNSIDRCTSTCCGDIEQLTEEDIIERQEALEQLDNQAIAESGMVCALEGQGYGNSTCCLECRHRDFCWKED